MNEDAATIFALTNWLPPDEWADDYAEFVHEIMDGYEDAVERPFIADVDMLSEHEHFTLAMCLAKKYLAEAGPALIKSFKQDISDAPAEAISLLKAVEKSKPSAYEVIEAVPGSHYMLLDLIAGGEAIRLSAEASPEPYVHWDLILGRMVKIRGRQILTAGSLILPREFVTEPRQMIREFEAHLNQESTGLPSEEIPELALEFFEDAMIHTWLAATALKKSAAPAVVNMEGDDFELVSLSYPIKGSPEPIAKALSGAEDFTEQDPINWVWIQPFKGSTIGYANLRLEGGQLLAECNSGRRGKKLTARLEKLLGNRIGRPLKMTGTIEREMSMLPPEPGPSLRDTLDPASRADLDAAMQQHILGTYLGQLDQVVPMLKGKPRELARSEKGRPDVVNWLKLLENSHERGGVGELGFIPDLTAVWESLGLLAYRNSPSRLLD